MGEISVFSGVDSFPKIAFSWPQPDTIKWHTSIVNRSYQTISIFIKFWFRNGPFYYKIILQKVMCKRVCFEYKLDLDCLGVLCGSKNLAFWPFWWGLWDKKADTVITRGRKLLERTISARRPCFLIRNLFSALFYLFLWLANVPGLITKKSQKGKIYVIKHGNSSVLMAHTHIASKKPSSKLHRIVCGHAWIFWWWHEFLDKIYLSHFFKNLKLIKKGCYRSFIEKNAYMTTKKFDADSM